MANYFLIKVKKGENMLISDELETSWRRLTSSSICLIRRRLRSNRPWAEIRRIDDETRRIAGVAGASAVGVASAVADRQTTWPRLVWAAN